MNYSSVTVVALFVCDLQVGINKFHLSRGHPKVKRLDMFHAPDYGNMKLAQMTRKMDEAKELDNALAKSIQ